jgi:uncharacterized protein with HEPN domain
MKDEIRTHLHDILHAGLAVKAFVAGRTFDDYLSDELLRSAIERKFEIMGEALNRVGRDDLTVQQNIRNYRDIISFRNILIHGYDAIDDRIVWGIIKEELDNLIDDVNYLLS